ncbi:hypothetical protein ACXXCT_08855 [Bordetella bronchiseptica]
MKLAARFLFDQAFDVPLISGGAALPFGPVLAPGVYVVHGLSYDMTQTGMYLFFDSTGTTSSARRLVTDSDALQMASALSWCLTHGAKDNGLSLSQLDSAARGRFIGVTCNPASKWVKKWLVSAGFDARIVRWLTMGPPNDFDDGHVGVEVFYGGKWVYVDPDIGCYFKDQAGSALSAAEVFDSVSMWDLSIAPLTLTPKIDTASTSQIPAGVDYATFSWCYLASSLLRRRWIQRIFQGIGVDATDGMTYWYIPDPSRQSWVEGQNGAWRVDADRSIWASRFY